MSSAHTLSLEDDWDLHVTPSGDLPVAFGAYSIAQNVSNTFRLLTKDGSYFPEKGIAYFLIKLKKEPMLNVLKSRLRKAALSVNGVKGCEISLLNFEGRDLSGMATLTLENGEKYNVEL